MPRHPYLSTLSSSSTTSDWPDKAVAILLKTYSEKFSSERGYLRGTDWQEVARCVNSACSGDLKSQKTLKQCRDKLDSLKRRYKTEKRKAVNGGEVSWPFFHRLDAIMNSVLKQGRNYAMEPHQKASSAVSDDEDAETCEDLQEEEDHLDIESRHDVATSSDTPSYSEDDKLAAEGLHDMSDGGGVHHLSLRVPQHFRNGVNSQQFRRYSHGHCQFLPSQRGHGHTFHPLPSFPSSRTYSISGRKNKPPEDTAYHCKAEITGPANKRFKVDGENGMYALAEAVTGMSKTGFSEVLSHIEEAKISILTKMNLELAKLEKSRHERNSILRK